MHYLADYGIFLAKIVTTVIALLALTAGILAIALKNRSSSKAGGTLEIKKLNEHYAETEEYLREELLDKKIFKQWRAAQKHQKKQQKQDDKNTARPRVFVLHFSGDIKASAVESLREEITALLSIATPKDEVVVCLESPGGMVHTYGLAASQLQRIKNHRIPLVVLIDKVAASGGYLMACIADKIIAAPFAIIGSIGVIAQMPNFHRWLEKNQIDFEQVTAGKYKRTLTLFGKNTDEAREKLKLELEEIHAQFKLFIQEHRPIVDLELVATGEHWLGSKARELNLVDELMTSDDYLLSHSKTTDIIELRYQQKKSLSEKFSHFLYKNLHKNPVSYY